MNKFASHAKTFALGFVVYFALAITSILIARLSHNVAVFWPANAVLVVIALTQKRFNPFTLLLSAFIANATTQVVLGDGWMMSVGLPLANAAEMILVYAGFTLARFETETVNTPQRCLTLLAIVALAAMPAAIIGSLTVLAVFGGNFFDLFVHWWAGDIVSSMIIYLPVLSYSVFVASGGLDHWVRHEKMMVLAALFASTIFGMMVLLALRLPPAVVVIFPTLWLALKGRVFGVALISSILSLATSAAVVTGYWPSLALDLPLRDAVFQQQTLALFCTFPCYLIAVAIANLEETQQELVGHNKVFETTLSNMNQGVSVFDKDHNLVLWNDQYLQAFGMKETDVKVGTPFLSLLELQKNSGNYEGETISLLSNILARVSRDEVYFAETALNSGTIIKSVHSPTPVGGWIGTHEDVTEMRLLEQRLVYESLHDVMTSLPNRRYFERELTDKLLAAKVKKMPLALFTFDLDNFKSINDTYGHDVGDEVIIWASNIIRKAARKSDFVARMGGDEFMLIVAGEKSLADVEHIAQSLRDELDCLKKFKGNICACRGSIGVAYSADGQVSRHDLLTQSDVALYAAKQAGKGTYKVYDFATGQYNSSLKAS